MATVPKTGGITRSGTMSDIEENRHPPANAVISIILLMIACGAYVGWAAGLLSFEPALMYIALMGACLASVGVL